MTYKDHYQVLVVGGGSGGITVAAYLANEASHPEVAIIEPSTRHYYQPLWTLVGAGVFPLEASVRNEADFIPTGTTWIQDAVATFEPEHNRVTLKSGSHISYDYLVVAMGIQIDWDKIKGLKESIGKDGVCSNYSAETVESTWDNIRTFRGGTALFTQPATAIKCGGAPQKIAYLAEDYFRKSGVRERTKVIFASAGAGIFGVKKYADTLYQVIARKQLETRFQHNLVEIRPDRREAVFVQLANDNAEVVINYDMIHVTPPMSAPDIIKQSPLADVNGWVDVDKYTLRHTRYANIFALGDCSNLPTSKTGAAIRKQAPVVVENIMASMAGKPLPATYDGYTSCPLVTGYGSLILAEFDYNQQPKETFPFDQAQERYSMYALKAYGLPAMYWNGMLRGRV